MRGSWYLHPRDVSMEPLYIVFVLLAHLCGLLAAGPIVERDLCGMYSEVMIE